MNYIPVIHFRVLWRKKVKGVFSICGMYLEKGWRKRTTRDENLVTCKKCCGMIVGSKRRSM